MEFSRWLPAFELRWRVYRLSLYIATEFGMFAIDGLVFTDSRRERVSRLATESRPDRWKFSTRQIRKSPFSKLFCMIMRHFCCTSGSNPIVILPSEVDNDTRDLSHCICPYLPRECRLERQACETSFWQEGRSASVAQTSSNRFYGFLESLRICMNHLRQILSYDHPNLWQKARAACKVSIQSHSFPLIVAASVLLRSSKN